VQQPKITTLNHGCPEYFCTKPPVKPTVRPCGSAYNDPQRGARNCPNAAMGASGWWATVW